MVGRLLDESCRLEGWMEGWRVGGFESRRMDDMIKYL